MKNKMVKIKKALISVSNKSGLKKFVSDLNSLDIKVVASGGTAKFIENKGFNVIDIEKITGFPQLLGGRVKTLHPKIHSSILADRGNQHHIKDLKKMEIDAIDLVVCDMYPFSDAVVKKKNIDYCVENIDIGGITLLRAAGKNFKYVTVITNISQYQEVINHLKDNKGYSTYKFRLKKANEAFKYSSNYDSQILKWLNQLNKKEFSEFIFPNEKLEDILSYGENAHQRAAFYQNENTKKNWGNFRKLQGKPLSFNNHLDLDASLNLLSNFREYKNDLVGIVKHTNPCGVSIGKNQLEAFNNAIICDPISAFGGIVIFNKKVNEQVANQLVNNFFEMVIAPEFQIKALKVFLKKKNLRLISLDKKWRNYNCDRYEFKSVLQGILIQETDTKFISGRDLKVVTKIAPTKKEIQDLIFAWNVVKSVKSNGIVIVKNMRTIGIGSGQPSRIDSSKLAIRKALNLKNKKNLNNAVMASDAFFPFSDGIEEAIENGVKAIIQPGGSIRDNEVIEIANKKNISMVFTGIRSFKH